MGSGAVVVWVCAGLVVAGLAIVLVAVWALTKRARPVRRALRRLSRRQEDLERLRERVDRLQARLTDLQEGAQRLAAQRAAAAPDGDP